MSKEKPLPQDPLIDYSAEGVPIAKTSENERTLPADDPKQLADDAQKTGLAGHEYEKKRQGTEDAQKRSDTGTGL
jgi:hypothetical protein